MSLPDLKATKSPFLKEQFNLSQGIHGLLLGYDFQLWLHGKEIYQWHPGETHEVAPAFGDWVFSENSSDIETGDFIWWIHTTRFS